MAKKNKIVKKENRELTGKVTSSEMVNWIVAGLLLSLFLISFASAGVGIKWDEERVLVLEEETTCLTYGVYNPWEEDSKAVISVSEEISAGLNSFEGESVFVSANTGSRESLPIEFCFETKEIYERDCLIGDKFICGRNCMEGQEVFSGEVLITEVNSLEEGQSSVTVSSVSAPLEVEVVCVPHSKKTSFIYFALTLLSIVVILILVRSERNKK